MPTTVKRLVIPKPARPALWWIRALARRPRAPLVLDADPDDSDGRPVFRLRSDFGRIDEKCPLGLMSSSVGGVPTPSGCGIVDRSQYPALRAFGHWWDGLSLDDARRAVDLIWPKTKKAKKGKKS